MAGPPAPPNLPHQNVDKMNEMDVYDDKSIIPRVPVSAIFYSPPPINKALLNPYFWVDVFLSMEVLTNIPQQKNTLPSRLWFLKKGKMKLSQTLGWFEHG